MTTARRRFSQEFKDELCQEVISTSKPIREVAQAYGVGTTTLRTRLPAAQRSPLPLPTTNTGSLRKTTNTTVRNQRSSPSLFGPDVTDSILPFNVPFIASKPEVLVGTAWCLPADPMIVALTNDEDCG